jgi:Na+/H+-translocating membrane pyrophosphatase
LKATDVGVDLIGKVEKGIPKNDPKKFVIIVDLTPTLYRLKQ